MKKNLLLISFLFLVMFSNAQSVNWLWARSACDLSAATSVTSVTTDPSGNIYIAGNFRDSARFGNTVFHPVGTANMFVAKYDSTGNFLWMLKGSGVNAPPYNLITDLCTDSLGNCYFTGFFNGNIIMSHDTITSMGSMPDVFVGKITSNGTIQWLQQGTGPASDYAYGIGLDAEGNCYVGGSFEQAISFGNMQLIANNSSNDIFVLRLDANGNFLSTHSFGGSALDLLSSMAVDKNGNCFLTGTFTSPELIIGMDTLHYASTGADAYIAKLDSGGNAEWARTAYGPGNQEPTSIATDPNGNCYVTGIFKADTMHIDTFTLVTYGYWDFFTAKYNSTGSLVWAGHQGSAAFGPEYSLGIAADSAGNSYTTGLFRNPATFDTINVTSIPAADIFVTKFNATGSAEWVEQSGSGTAGLTSAAIHIDEQGNIFITGSYEASTIIGDDSLVVLPGYTAGYYIAKIGSIDTTTTSIHSAGSVKTVLNLYPVPATTNLYFTSSEKIETISVFDMMGNKVLQENYSGKNMLDISFLSPGIYMLEVGTESVLLRKKFVKQ